MRRGNLTRQRLAALACLGAVLFGYPLVGLPGGVWLNAPASLLYLFAIWLLLIVLAALIAERGR